MDKDKIYEKLKEILVSEFKLEPDSIGAEKQLDEDLGLDSLDTIDLLLYFGDFIERKIDPVMFKDAHTIQNVVDLLHTLWKSA